ncbi:hypothetical protein LXL04_010044 [Taraxacum kok-saghyz]
MNIESDESIRTNSEMNCLMIVTVLWSITGCLMRQKQGGSIGGADGASGAVFIELWWQWRWKIILRRIVEDRLSGKLVSCESEAEKRSSSGGDDGLSSGGCTGGGGSSNRRRRRRREERSGDGDALKIDWRCWVVRKEQSWRRLRQLEWRRWRWELIGDEADLTGAVKADREVHREGRWEISWTWERRREDELGKWGRNRSASIFNHDGSSSGSRSGSNGYRPKQAQGTKPHKSEQAQGNKPKWNKPKSKLLILKIWIEKEIQTGITINKEGDNEKRLEMGRTKRENEEGSSSTSSIVWDSYGMYKINHAISKLEGYSRLEQAPPERPESRSFENSYIPENPRTPKPLTFSKNRLRGAKNRSNISPVAKFFFRKNDFFFPKTLHMCKLFFCAYVHSFLFCFKTAQKHEIFLNFFYRSLYNTYLKRQCDIQLTIHENGFSQKQPHLVDRVHCKSSKLRTCKMQWMVCQECSQDHHFHHRQLVVVQVDEKEVWQLKEFCNEHHMKISAKKLHMQLDIYNHNVYLPI